MKVLRRALLGLALALPTWLLASESGLQFAFAVLERLSGGRVSVAEVHGRLIGEVSLRQLEVITPAASVRIERADLRLLWSRLLLLRLQAEQLDIQTLAIAVHERPARKGERVPLGLLAPLRLAVEEGHIKDFRLRLAHAGRDWVVPQADFSARWRGRWIVIGNLAADTAEAGRVQLHGRIAIADDLLHFEDFEVAAPATVHLAGVMALTDQALNALSLKWERLRYPKAGVLDWLGSPQGALRVDGPWPRYAWMMEAQTDAIGMAGQLSAHGHGDLKALGIEELRVRALDGIVNGSGRVEWSPAVRTELDLRWAQLNPGLRFAEWPGRLNGGVKLAARWDQHQPHVEFDGGFDDSKLRGFAFALQTRGTTEQKQVTLREFALQSGVSTLNAHGALWPRMDLKGDVRSTDFASLWAGLSGRGQATFSAQGTLDTLRFGAHVDAQSVAYRKVRAGTLALDADVGFQGHSEATLKIGKLKAGVTLDELVLSGSGTRQAHEASLVVKGSEGAAALKFAGGESKGTWSGQLTDATLTPAQDTAWTLEEPATLVARLSQLRLEPSCFSGSNSRACVDLDLKPGAQGIAFRIHQFDLKHLRPWLPNDWSMAGTLSGTAAMQIVDGELLALKVDLEGSAGSIAVGGVKLAYAPGSLHVLPDEGRLEAALHLAPAGGTIDGKVYITAGGPLLDRPMLGDLRVKLPDLTWLPVLSPEIASAQGSIDADLNVSGTLLGSSRVDLQACKLEYSIVSPK